jgi:hypothetical protein
MAATMYSNIRYFRTFLCMALSIIAYLPYSLSLHMMVDGSNVRCVGQELDQEDTATFSFSAKYRRPPIDSKTEDFSVKVIIFYFRK